MGGVSPLTKEKAKILYSQLDKYICKIYSVNETSGTGFFCKIPFPNEFRLLPVLITNAHVLNTEKFKINQIKITLEDDAIEKTLTLNDSRIIYINETIDITIIEIKPDFDKINNFLDVDENIYNESSEEYYKKKEVYILQYPKAQKSSFSLGIIVNIYNNNVRHKCSTEYGSSGSPILNLSNYKVIAIHKRGTIFNFNEGTFIKCVIEDFNRTKNKILDNNKETIIKQEKKENLNLSTNNIINKNNQIINNKSSKSNKAEIMDKRTTDDKFHQKSSHNLTDNSSKKKENNINNANATGIDIKYKMFSTEKLYAFQQIRREYKDIYENPLLNIGVLVDLPNKDNLFEWRCSMIGASDSCYRNGLFFLKVLFPDNYPKEAPEIRFITPIYHVNVNHRGNSPEPLGYISISTLNWWHPDTTMRKVFCDIFVMINYLPNGKDPYGLERAHELRNNRILYEKKAQYFTDKYAAMNIVQKEYQEWDFTYTPLEKK